MVLPELRFLAQTHDSQRRRHRALAGGEERAYHQHLGVFLHTR